MNSMMSLTTNPVTGEEFSAEEKAMFDEMVYEEMMKIENEMQLIKEQQASIARQKEMVNSRLLELENGKDDEFDLEYNMTLDEYNNKSPVKELPFSNLKQVSILNPFNQDVWNKASEINQKARVIDSTQNSVEIVVPSKSNTAKYPPSQVDEDVMKKRQKDLAYFKQLEIDQVNRQAIAAQTKEKELARELQKRDHLPIGAPVLVNAAPRNGNHITPDDDFEINPLMLGKDPLDARNEKKQKQQLYLQQLNMQRVEKENSALNMNPRPPQLKKDIVDEEWGGGSHNTYSTDATKQIDIKKMRQKKYFEDLSSATASQPIKSERVSLVKNRQDRVQFVDKNDSFMNSLPIGRPVDDKNTRKEKQMRYFKELSDATKLPVISNVTPAPPNPRFEIAKARKSLIESVDHNYYQQTAINDEQRIKKMHAQQEYARQLNEAVKTKQIITQSRNSYDSYLEEQQSPFVSGFGKPDSNQAKTERQHQYARQLNEDKQLHQNSFNNSHEYQTNLYRNNSFEEDINNRRDLKIEEEMEYRQLVMEAALKEFQRKKALEAQDIYSPAMYERNRYNNNVSDLDYDEQSKGGLRRVGRPQEYANQLHGQI